MWFGSSQSVCATGAELKPFVLRIRDGYLIGMAMEPSVGSPCSGCVRLWLESRQVVAQEISPEELPIKRELLKTVRQENSAHIFYQVHLDGSTVRLENAVFPHPDCTCQKENFSPPASIHADTIFAFSPITQIKCVRYTTPSGHLWLTSAHGTGPSGPIQVYGAGDTKAQARERAVHAWMRRAAGQSVSRRLEGGEVLAAEVLQTGNEKLVEKISHYGLTAIGVGKNALEATLDGLYGLACVRTLRRYSGNLKQPMLFVGSNSWLKQRIPFFMLQEYDIYLLFYPNSSPSWVVGAAALSRISSDTPPVFVFDAHANLEQALTAVLGRLLERCRPDLENSTSWVRPPISGGTEINEKNRRLNMWWTHWLYRCSKLDLKDAFQMESYPADLKLWQEYFRDGQPTVNLIPVNPSWLPTSMRTLIEVHLEEVPQESGKVRGIGTMVDFQSGVAGM